MSLRELIIAVIFAAIAVAGPASANSYDSEAVQEQLAERFESAKQRLDLTEEQIPLVEEILRDSAMKRRAVLEKYDVGGDTRLSRRELRRLKNELEPISAETNEALSQILSPAQLAEFEEMQEEQRAEFRAKLRERRSS